MPFSLPLHFSRVTSSLVAPVLLGLAAFLAGCGDAIPSPTSIPTARIATSPTSLPIPTRPPTAARSATPTLSRDDPFPTASSPPYQEICFPLEGFEASDLPDLITNPFSPPKAGSDDPHQGMDLADIEPLSRISLEGRAVLASLPGTIAAAMEDRFPYGNAVLVETPLDGLPAGWTQDLDLPDPATPNPPHPSLTCPESPNRQSLNTKYRSLYLLYAHMRQPPVYAVGDSVTCGQVLGSIGGTGNALNPHLHLEARVGPAGARFSSLAHYEPSASEAEMANYCLWRVSGLFQLLDPGVFFTLSE